MGSQAGGQAGRACTVGRIAGQYVSLVAGLGGVVGAASTYKQPSHSTATFRSSYNNNEEMESKGKVRCS